MEKERPTLEEIFHPRGVAVVGVSPSRGWANTVVQSLKKAGFPAIYPVNPKYNQILELPCYSSIRNIPGIVDHVIVSIPAQAVLALLDDCIAKGVKSVHFFTAGFTESGYTERADLERTMLSKARAGGFRIIGPNSVGLFVPRSRLVNKIATPLEPGPVAFISQSGGYVEDIHLSSAPRGLRFSKVVSYGNALDVNESELLEYLSTDPDTEIIALYIEGVRDGRRFVRALREAAARKPVVICKGGITEAGTRTTYGHTASLTSSLAVFEALCKQMRAIRVDDVEELIDVLVALNFTNPLPRGTGVAVIGAGGGVSVMAADEIEKAGLHLPRLSAETQAELKQFLPFAGGILSNPVDAENIGTPEAISSTMRVLSQIPEIHLLIYHLGFHPLSQWGLGRFSAMTFLQPVTETFQEVQKATGKPVLLVLRPTMDLASLPEFLAAQEAFVKAGLPVFHSFRQAARAIARIIAWKQSQQ